MGIALNARLMTAFCQMLSNYVKGGLTLKVQKEENQPDAYYAKVEIGYWIYHYDDVFPDTCTQECSVCHEKESQTIRNDNFCPNCGASMTECDPSDDPFTSWLYA